MGANSSTSRQMDNNREPHFVDGATLHNGLREQVAGQLHLAEHTNLWRDSLAVLDTGFGKGDGAE